jgi:DNA invertase Pin-like site-specific DNA recombinase
VKRAALYLRVSTLDQNPETQGLDLRRQAEQRGFTIFAEYVDHGISGTRAGQASINSWPMLGVGDSTW